MSPLWGHLAGVFILLMMAAFICIWAWAWLPRHRRAFHALAALPMEDQGAGATRPLTDGDTPAGRTRRSAP
jgi:cytochrome c oxidase cbb3-type subunit 4